MRVNNINSNTNFGAIFKYTKTSSSACDIIEKAIKESTVPAEAEKISKKFQIGGGSLYVYVPDENMKKLFDKLKYITRESYIDLLTRVD